MRSLIREAASALTLAACFELLALGLFMALIVTAEFCAVASMRGAM